MNKFLMILASLTIGTSAFSHDLWVKTSNEDVIKADLIYGHDFPTPEEIAQKRLSLFEPIEVIGENKSFTLSQKGENYTYVGKEKLQEGTYIIKATYKPTAWIKTADGKWEMNKTRKDTQKEVKQCGIYSKSAKEILVVGNSTGEFATKALGKGLEITPLEKASNFKEGNEIKFKITRDGKPLKIHEVYGSIDTYSKDETIKAFYTKTNLKGEFIFKPLKSGLWYLSTSYKKESENKDCETVAGTATISFKVK